MGRPPVLLITGAGGQVGRALRSALPDARFLDKQELDVCDDDAVEQAVDGADVVIHCAAFTNVDACENQPERAHEVNALGTRNVAAHLSPEALLVYLSTDYVFDGAKSSEYEEEDEPNPLNVYGRTKLEGEKFVKAHPKGLIVRTSWVIGEGRNFVSKILAAAEDSPVDVVDDQRGRPTFAADLAVGLKSLVEAGTTGIVHLTNGGPIGSWADLAEQALRIAGRATRVRRVDSATYRSRVREAIAARPANSALNCRRATDLGITLPDWRASLEKFARAMGDARA